MTCSPWRQSRWPPKGEALHNLPVVSAAAQPRLLPGPRSGTQLDHTQAYLNLLAQQKTIPLVPVGLVT